MPHAVRYRGQTAPGVGVADQHSVGLVRHADEPTIDVVAVRQHMALIVLDLLHAEAAVGVLLEHTVGVLHSQQPAKRAETEFCLIGAQHGVARH